MSEQAHRHAEQDVEKEQEKADHERKGRAEAGRDPAEERDPRGDREPPEPFSGSDR